MTANLDQAHWIAHPGKDIDCPLFRHEFTVAHPLQRARLRVNALGYFEAWLNGTRVADRVLEPGVSNYAKRSFVLEFDVTASIAHGRNCLGIAMARGWYRKAGPNRFYPFPGVVHDGPVVRAELLLTSPEGDTTVVRTGTGWCTDTSHLVGLGHWFNKHFAGERFDARRLRTGWTNPGYDHSAWLDAAQIDIPKHTVTAYEGPPTRILRTWKPTSITRMENTNDAWLVDVGRELTGWLEIDFGSAYEAGHELVIEYSDRPPGPDFNDYDQWDEYICSGNGNEVFCNTFNYHAFRWAVIRGCREKPVRVEAKLIAADLADAGQFECDNDRLNGIHDLQQYTLRCVTLGGVQVDCPHRERLGYGGDGTASLDSTLYLFDADRFYRNWLALWRDEQRPSGGLPHTAPSPHHAGGGPVWCGFPITAAWTHYLHYGDPDVLREEYPAAMKWLAFCDAHSDAEGLLQTWPNEEHRNWFLGDWLPPEGVDPKEPDSVSLVVNCFMVQCRDRMARMASILGHRDDAQKHAELAARLRSAIHARFYNTDAGTYADGDQLDLAYPLLVEAVPDALRTAVLDRLEQLITATSPARLGTGLVGTFVLIDCLLAAGRNDLLFHMINHDEYPGWGYMLHHGAGTTWEAWDGEVRSRIHNTFNQAGGWFYKGLAGILPDPEQPGFKNIIIRPEPVRELGRMSATHASCRGSIHVAWTWVGDRFEMNIAIPPESRATVYVPCGSPNGLRRDGKPCTTDELVHLGVYRYALFKGIQDEATFETEGPWLAT